MLHQHNTNVIKTLTTSPK